MSIMRTDVIDIELSRSGTVHRSFCNHAIGMGDITGNRFGVRITMNGEAVNMATASCTGYFIRPDGITLVITGGISGNEAYVDLPQAAYAKAGQYTLAIKVSGTGYIDTLRIVDGTVVETTTGDIADPSSEVPSLADLTAIIAAAEAAADEIDDLSVAAVQITGTRYKITVTKE